MRRRAIADARDHYLGSLAHRALDPPPSSSLAEGRAPPLPSPRCGGARLPTLATLIWGRSRIALWIRRRRRRSQREERLRSLLLGGARLPTLATLSGFQCASRGSANAVSVASFAERDHEQMLQAHAYYLGGEIPPVMDQRSDDVSRFR